MRYLLVDETAVPWWGYENSLLRIPPRTFVMLSLHYLLALVVSIFSLAIGTGTFILVESS